MLVLGIVLAVALGLRVWGARQGLPFAYNPDEQYHFVPKAVGFHKTGDFDPHYFINPPGLTYMLYGVFGVRYGGSDGVVKAFASDSGGVFLTARLAVAALGTFAVFLLYLVGARLFDRRAGLLAAALLAVSFLAVSWSHLAVNDVPTTAAVALSLLGTAGILRRGWALDYVLAGAGLGLACAIKYTAGIVILPLLVAAAVQFRRERVSITSIASRLGLALGATLATFVLFNPYALLAPREFLDGLLYLSVTPEGEPKLGQADKNGILYYMWVLSWGLGWVPSLAALGGAVTAFLRNRVVALLLVPAPILYILFMGVQERYFGRWLLPVLPIVCLLAAYGTLALLDALRRRRGSGVAAAAAALAVVALLAQSVLYSVHNGFVLSRADTRNLTRDWLFENVPPKSRVFFDRIAPRPWFLDPGAASPTGKARPRWREFALRRALAVGHLAPPDVLGKRLQPEDYTRRLQPGLIDVFERQRVCWVVTGSFQYGRAFAEPEEVPQAVSFYNQLARRAKVAYLASPYDPGEGLVAFNFDWSTDYYPLAYHRPGPEMIVYRLSGGRCAS